MFNQELVYSEPSQYINDQEINFELSQIKETLNTMKTTSQNQAFKALTFNDLQNDAYLAEALDFIYSEDTD